MKAELRTVMSSEFNVEKERPPDPHYFCVGVEMGIGTEDHPGSDYFQIQICSPEWLEKHWGKELFLDESTPFVWDKRPLLIAAHFSFPEIKAFLEKEISQVTGNDWEEIAEKINRFSQWEFDNYGRAN